MNVFSIVIPVYNGEKYILETLKSVYDQTYENYEVIIIDDASNDMTSELIKESIKDRPNCYLFVNTTNKGVANSRNIGFGMCKGDYIALLDADDLWDSKKLEKQYEVIRNTRADLVYTSYKFIDEESKLIKDVYRTKEVASYNSLLKENYIGCSSVVFKREISDTVKMNSKYAHEDFVFWLECLKKGYEFKGISEALMLYRISSSGRSFNKKEAMLNRFRVLRYKEELTMFEILYFMLWYIINSLKKYSKLKLRNI